MTVKVIELVGESKNSWQEAVQNAVKDASKTIRNITGVEVLNNTANVKDGNIVEYKANVKIAFKVDGTS
ncbi:MAG TPA: dodecin domain-containing protein [Thermoanaerobacterales bacterium]|uniref:dodecin family protein n=1 Tax=Tepidanaerobacter sp. GT38 TaxID=2722793 RepID=UPI0017ECCC3C|nr:dodecin family protein [Tepidanaerobacter sp. GT38]MCG1012661.1 dodecin domain-containing protein [Tepidanaerobacter sp. GT38]HHY41404.1 dodecin domain-containing protein [Thermoanaerobacterales bacterium]